MYITKGTLQVEILTTDHTELQLALNIHQWQHTHT